MAPGASSAPRPFGVDGPAAQELLDGVYSAVRLLPPIWNTRPSGSRNAGPSSAVEGELISDAGTFPVSTQVPFASVVPVTYFWAWVVENTSYDRMLPPGRITHVSSSLASLRSLVPVAVQVLLVGL